MINLDTKITELNRVGKTISGRLKILGIETAEDLLFYFPFRYDDFSSLKLIKNLQPGESTNVVGQIEMIQNKKSFKKGMHITEALINDETETLKVIWFNQPFIARNLKTGDKISLAGKVESDFSGPVMRSPSYEKLFNDQAVHTQGLVPNYHLTAGLTNKQLRFLMKQAIPLAKEISDWLPSEIVSSQGFCSLSDAIRKIHFPKNKDDITEAKNRLSFNEIFFIQLQQQIARNDLEKSIAPEIIFSENKTKRFVESLPFKLTDSQRKAAWEILIDMGKSRPMSRILSGDVGSGKTIVAVIAMLNAVLSGKQAALMAPTEILARQHFETFCKLFYNYNFQIALLTGSEKKIFSNTGTRNIKKSEIKSLKSEIMIGTHSLVQKEVKFKNLGLAIIDEQHRFGVNQRAALIRTNTDSNGLTETSPHYLSMTATPIPRSLALAIYGDLDLSTLNQMPSERKKIITKLIFEEKREIAYKFIRKEIENGRQVFVICPLIDESDKLGVKSVKTEFKKLDQEIFPEIKIGILHGKMKSDEKEKIMREFQDNIIKILVSTSVIEVGIDIPNASVMMIEGADRFGLAQLHQFRGRVGRSNFQSYCLLFTENSSDKTNKRLNALLTCHDGFALANMDLKLRGAGEIYGTVQKGFPDLKIADLFDYKLMKKAKHEAEKIIARSPDLEKYPDLKSKIDNARLNAHLE